MTKLVGKLADFPIINKYSLSKLKFNEIFKKLEKKHALNSKIYYHYTDNIF